VTEAPIGWEAEPLRAELFSLDQLRQYAAALARLHETGTQRGKDRLLARLDDNERVLREAHDVVAQAAIEGRRIALAAEWLLDNFYLVEQQTALARRYLPPEYSRELPQLSRGPSAGRRTRSRGPRARPRRRRQRDRRREPPDR